MISLPILFLALSTLAQDELAVETYCFPSEAARERAQGRLTSILVSSDKIEAEKECFTVQMRPHRRELIQNYTSRLDPAMAVTFSSAELKREPCKLKVEKVRAGKAASTNAQLSQFPSAGATQTTEAAQDVMKIQTLDKFSFTVSQDAIEGNCRYVNKDLYDITISVRRDPLPLVPPNLPAGAVVVVQTPPPAQKTMALSTNLQLTRGSRVEIGSIVKDLRKKNLRVDAKPEAALDDSKMSDEEKVYVSFE